VRRSGSRVSLTGQSCREAVAAAEAACFGQPRGVKIIIE